MGSGVLGLASPWARGALPEPLRSELQAAIPEGFTIGVGSDANRNVYHVWVNRGADVAIKDFHGRDAEWTVRQAIEWTSAQTACEEWIVNSDGTVSVTLTYMRVES